MLRLWACVAGLSVVVSPAFAGLLIGNNPNVNDGGLNTPVPGAWTKVVVQHSGAFSDAVVRDDHNGIVPDDGGDWDVAGSEGSGQSPKVDSYYYQRFTVASGQVTAGSNNISLSGWSKAWAQWWSGENWQWLQESHVELWVDGTMVFDGISSNNTNRDQWKLHQYAGTHNVTNHIEVRLHTIKGNDQNGSGPFGAIYWNSRYDDIRLFTCATGSVECCSNPLAVSSVTPSSFVIPPTLGNEQLTVTGSNLNTVTSVRLTGPATIEGVIDSSAAGQLKATFPLATAPVGSYGLMLDRDNGTNCPDLTHLNALTINCVIPNAVVETIQHDRGLRGNAAHKIRLTGQNLSSLSVVRLRKSNSREGVANINATNLTMVGNDLEATFDLTNAEAGRWDVVYRTPEACATVTPTAHLKAFLVYLPEITNGGFEEPYAGSDVKTALCPMAPPDNPKAKHWDEYRTGPQHGGAHRRDGHFFGPNCIDGKVQNISGNHYGGTDFITDSMSTWTVFQTIAAPTVNAQNISTAPFNVRAELAGNGGYEAEPVTMRIRLIDGTESDVQQVLGEAVLISPFVGTGLFASPDYNAIVPAGSQYLSDPPILTIAIEFATVGSGVTGIGYYGFWVDNVRTGPFVPPSCFGRTVWADNNGDQAVDMKDFAELQACMTVDSAPGTPLPFECVCLDRNYDERIGEPDLVEFIKCATGPAIPWTPEAAPLCVGD